MIELMDTDTGRMYRIRTRQMRPAVSYSWVASFTEVIDGRQQGAQETRRHLNERAAVMAALESIITVGKQAAR